MPAFVRGWLALWPCLLSLGLSVTDTRMSDEIVHNLDGCEISLVGDDLDPEREYLLLDGALLQQRGLELVNTSAYLTITGMSSPWLQLSIYAPSTVCQASLGGTLNPVCWCTLWDITICWTCGFSSPRLFPLGSLLSQHTMLGHGVWALLRACITPSYLVPLSMGSRVLRCQLYFAWHIRRQHILQVVNWCIAYIHYRI